MSLAHSGFLAFSTGKSTFFVEYVFISHWRFVLPDLMRLAGNCLFFDRRVMSLLAMPFYGLSTKGSTISGEEIGCFPR